MELWSGVRPGGMKSLHSLSPSGYFSLCLPLLLLAGGSWLVVAGGDHFSSVSDRRRDWARLWTNAIRLVLTCDGIN